MHILRESFRKRSNCIAAILSEAGHPLLQLAGRLSSTGAPSSSRHWRSGILIGADHIGDILWLTPSLPMLKNALPDISWSILAPPPSCELIETNPAISKFIPLSSSPKDMKSRLVLMKCLAAGRFDVAVCYNSGMYWKDLILATLAGIPNRVGYVHKGFSGLVTHPVAIDYPKPYAAYFRDLVAGITETRPEWPLRPQVYPTERDCRDADDFWRDLGFDGNAPVLACFVGTRQPGPTWPKTAFAESLRLIAASSRAQIVLCGAASDLDLLSGLRTLSGLDCRICAGNLNLRALVCLLRKCSAVLTLDSGPRHLANAAGVPVFFIRNLWFDRTEAGKYVDSEHDLAPGEDRLNHAEAAGVLATLDPGIVAETVSPLLTRKSF